MTLLVTVLAAVISTAVWYSSEKARSLKVSSLMFMYWGAALMWLVDAVFEYAELRAEFFTPAPADMINDLFLGFAAVAFGLVIWTVILLVKDPKGVLKAALIKK
ncbi:hypothetical protein [Huintestinicola sp.]|uniref:hypothetical protein n=1 Tax=Huintestinicola sp. TaxID=2981661 RepID=UPI003D7E631C